MKLFRALLVAIALSGLGGHTAIAQPPGVAAPKAFASSNTPSDAIRADAVMANFPDFSGVVVVLRDGRPVFRKAFGLANRELSVPNTSTTKFRIASITKPFTAMAVLQLVDAGKISLDDPVSKYDPAAPAAWNGITVRHLLTHSSGIPDYTVFLTGRSRDPHTPAQIVDIVRDKPLSFTPGSRYAYSSTGYALLGMAIEKASGQTYEQYVQRNIFEPLGMKDSGYDSFRAILPNRAAGYVRTPTGYSNAAYSDMSVPYAAGALYSTADDLVLWDQALAAGKLVSPAAYQAMWTDQGFGYGYGWIVGQQFGRRRVGHNGDIAGFTSLITRFPDDKISVIVLSNVQAAPRDAIGDEMAAVYLHVPERTATPGGEAAVRKLIEDTKRGEPDYTKMSTVVAATTRQQLASMQRSMSALGDIRSITLVRATPQGRDIYRVDGTSGSFEFDIILTPEGVLESLRGGPVPRTPQR